MYYIFLVIYKIWHDRRYRSFIQIQLHYMFQKNHAQVRTLEKKIVLIDLQHSRTDTALSVRNLVAKNKLTPRKVTPYLSSVDIPMTEDLRYFSVQLTQWNLSRRQPTFTSAQGTCSVGLNKWELRCGISHRNLNHINVTSKLKCRSYTKSPHQLETLDFSRVIVWFILVNRNVVWT